MHRLLLVEDDRSLSTMLAELLADEGYAVDASRDGQRGLHLGLTNPYDVMVVDRGLPAIEGVDLIGRLRRSGVTAPILVLTARGGSHDRVEGLDAGADDYLVKPFDIEELLARLRALLRRHGDSAETLVVGGRRLVVAERLVHGGPDGPVELSPRECDLLALMARRPKRIFTREELLAEIFGDADTSGVVDTYVHYLRRKLGHEVVRTVRGSGYRIGTA